jgi:D-glycero-D-manno-heptose 1,7-bisphosphate phosphatase
VLRSSGFGVAIATNQSGLESEKFNLSDLENFNKELTRQVANTNEAEIHLIAICPHLSTSECSCRKPKPGLLQTIDEVGMGKVKLFVGNSETDKLAAVTYGIEYIDVGSESLASKISEWTNK